MGFRSRMAMSAASITDVCSVACGSFFRAVEHEPPE
jgi:hypothetical protein